MPIWIISWSSEHLIFLLRTQSSAKNRTIEFMLSGRSLIKIKINTSPATEPWGTPDNTGTWSEHKPSRTTFCVRPDSQAEIMEDIISKPYYSRFKKLYTFIHHENMLLLFWPLNPHFYSVKKKGNEKSRECHNHKPQPFPDPKGKRKPTNPNKHKSNRRTKSTKIRSLPQAKTGIYRGKYFLFCSKS